VGIMATSIGVGAVDVIGTLRVTVMRVGKVGAGTVVVGYFVVKAVMLG
jgi:hypothetical protein